MEHETTETTVEARIQEMYLEPSPEARHAGPTHRKMSYSGKGKTCRQLGPCNSVIEDMDGMDGGGVIPKLDGRDDPNRNCDRCRATIGGQCACTIEAEKERESEIAHTVSALYRPASPVFPAELKRSGRADTEAVPGTRSTHLPRLPFRVSVRKTSKPRSLSRAQQARSPTRTESGQFRARRSERREERDGRRRAVGRVSGSVGCVQRRFAAARTGVEGAAETMQRSSPRARRSHRHVQRGAEPEHPEGLAQGHGHGRRRRLVEAHDCLLQVLALGDVPPLRWLSR